MARLTGFVFQDQYLEQLAKLSDQELGRLVRALAQYHMTGEAQELAGRESIAYDFIRADIDRIDNKYEQKCETNRINRQRPSTTDNDRYQPSTSSNERAQVIVKEKVIVKENNKEISPKGDTKKAASRFSPPTVDEVRAYCKERGNNVNAEAFVDFYASKGWKVGGNAMKDWQAAVRTWERRDDYSVRQGGGQRQEPKRVHAQDYTQRVYTAQDLSAASEALIREALADND